MQQTESVVRFRPASTGLDEPWSVVAEDRARCPLGYSEEVGARQVTRYADIKEILLNHQVFSSKYHQFMKREEPVPLEDQVLSLTDPPRHRRQRRLLTVSLSASRIGRMEDRVQRTVDSFVDRIIESGPEFELNQDFARPFPALITAELMGVPEHDRERFAHYSHLNELDVSAPGTYARELEEWSDYIEELVRRRRREGAGSSDDLITTMCFAEVEGERFSEREIAQMVRILNAAGNTTTSGLFGNIVWLLERHPEQKAKFLADIDGLTDSLVEEGLRFDGPVLGLYRRALSDVTLSCGTSINEGEWVWNCFTAGSHDPAVYSEPDSFRIDRDWSDLPLQMAFGMGAHYCMGANLARLEVRSGIAALYRRLPNLEVRPGFVPQQVPGAIFRGWETIEMRHDAG